MMCFCIELREGTMRLIAKTVFLMTTPVLIVISGLTQSLPAQTALSGSALESACQVYADKAVNYAKEWEQLQCQKKLNVSPQIFDADRTYQYNRCKNSVGTSIASDLKLMENELAPCRAIAGRPGNPPGRPEPPRPPTNGRDNITSTEKANADGDLWEIVVINSADLGRSDHAYRIGSMNRPFTAKNTRSNGIEFTGELKGSQFEGLMTDKTGYRATLIGHLSNPGRIDGTGCDNRGRSYSFTMTRR
jgi:hypothetical protein